MADTTFNAGSPSSDFLTPLSATLSPGEYALVFGSGQFGASSTTGFMPTDNTDVAGASFFTWNGFTSTWQNSSATGLRFVVEGNAVPEPSSLALLLAFVSVTLGLLYLLRARCNPRRDMSLSERTQTRESTAFVCLAGVLVFGVMTPRALAQNTFYVSGSIQSSPAIAPFGTINASGQETPIGPGLNFGETEAPVQPNLLIAPNGTLYAYDSRWDDASHPWGTVNPNTGTFTQIGDLNSEFSLAYQVGNPPIIGFDSNGNLLATGYASRDNNGNLGSIFGTYDLTTGAFQQTASSSQGFIQQNDFRSNPGQIIVSVPSTLAAGGGTSTIGGGQVSFSNLTTPGTFSTTFYEPTAPQQVQQAIGALAADQINFVLAGTPNQFWDLEFSGTFQGDATVVLHFASAALGSTPLADLEVEHFTNGLWVLPPNQVVDPINDTITFTTDSFSPFALTVVPEPGTVSLLAAGRLLRRAGRSYGGGNCGKPGSQR